MCNSLKKLYVEYPWLKEVDSCSLRCAIFNLEDTYKNFFAGRSKYPVFKSKYQRQSYRTNCMRIEYKGKDYSSIELDLKNKKDK
jgi:transposase